MNVTRSVRAVQRRGKNQKAARVTDPAQRLRYAIRSIKPALVTDVTDVTVAGKGDSAVLDRIVGVIRQYVALPDGASEAAALWVAFTYTIEAFDTAPILAVLSPVKGCGKTTLVMILRALVWNSLVASNISTSALFRVINKLHPTLLIDEIDTQLSHRNEDLRSILNAGHTRTTAKVIRSVGDGKDYKPLEFDVWAAKVLAGIGKLPPTVQDRAITIPMRRRLPHEQVERIRQDRIDGRLEPLRVTIKEWADRRLADLREADPVLPDGLSDRARDNWRPLLAIADAVGGEWPTRARRAALLLNDSPALEEDRGTLLLADIRNLFDAGGGQFLRTDQMLSDLNRLDERPWGTYSYGQPLSSHTLARLLQPFGITPKLRRQGHLISRGYSLHDFHEAFTRYLPPDTVTTVTTVTDQQNRPVLCNGLRTGFSVRRENAYDPTELDTIH